MDEIIGEDYHLLDKLVSDFKDYDLFKFLLIEDYDTMGLALEYIRQKIYFETNLKNVHDLRRKACFKTVKSEIKTLGEVCEFKNGKVITKTTLKKGIYPVIGGGKSPFGYHNKLIKMKIQFYVLKVELMQDI